MRTVPVLLVFSLLLAAQDSPVVRGVLVRRDPGVQAGELSLRTSDSRIYRYRFDAQTYVERENRPANASDLKPGDPLEVVSEATGGGLRAARSIHVLSSAPVERHRPVPVESPKGDLAFAGLILRVDATRFLLHPRAGADREFLLRHDTRYGDNGAAAGSEDLRPGMHVFVRGARNNSGNLEAYEVIWGSMLAPK